MFLSDTKQETTIPKSQDQLHDDQAQQSSIHSRLHFQAGPARGGRKVGRKPAFSHAEVVAAAIAEGIDRFTLSSVAQRLGVVSSAIYRLFPSRDDLLVACLDHAGNSIATPEPGMTWTQTLRLWADECWRLCEDYPGLERALYMYPAASTRIEPVFRAYMESLAKLGISAGQATFALDFIGDTVISSHLGVEALRRVRDDGRTGIELYNDVVDADAIVKPNISWVGRDLSDAKVEFILSGLEHNWPTF